MPETWKGEERRKHNSPICELHCLLVLKIDAIEKKLDATHKAIFGPEENPTSGLYFMVSENTKFINTVKKIFWPIVTFSMIGVISAFANLVRGIIFHIYK
jgi:hypothetical protein